MDSSPIKFVEYANLPTNKVTHVIISQCANSIIHSLNSIGINTILAEKCNFLNEAECHHADMQCVHLGNNEIFVLSECNNLKRQLEDLKFNVYTTQKRLKKNYPHNVLLNACILGDTIICNPDTVDKELLQKHRKVISVKQGYCRCSIAVVSQNAVITADEGIYRSLKNSDIDCLKISTGNIELPGFDYGFIGGCCGKLSKDILAFSGKLESHPNSDNIKAFLRNYNVYSENLNNEKLIDIGGILPVMEGKIV